MQVPQFKMWMGIVEDRADPENLGRYRVRVLGYHTANKAALPTNKLPWAVPLMPVTSASISGVGENPCLVEGSTVVGFFADGVDEQTPVIIGAYHGLPTSKLTNPEVGFSDPYNKYPRSDFEDGYNVLGEPDLSRLARGVDAETHASLKQKRTNRVTEVPTAKASSVSTVGEDISSASYESGKWDEPHPRFGSTDEGTYTTPGQAPTFEDGTTSVYPFNHVRETESGHIFEIDDTPGNGRIHEYHNSGTFYEIQADGTKVTKVVGADYEIVVGGKNVSITGGCNITIKGDCKLRVDGDYYEEINGNKFTTITGDHHTKVEGNKLYEIGTGFGMNVVENFGLRIGGVLGATIVQEASIGVGKSLNIAAGGNIAISSVQSISTMATLDNTMTAGKNVTAMAATGTARLSGLSTSVVAVQDQTFASATGSQLFECPLTQQIFAGTAQTMTAGAAQSFTAGAAQTLTATAAQTMTAASQSITAATRSITGITSHTGNYTVTGTVSGTIVKQGIIILGTHKHTVGGSAAPSTGTPIA